MYFSFAFCLKILYFLFCYFFPKKPLQALSPRPSFCSVSIRIKRHFRVMSRYIIFPFPPDNENLGWQVFLKWKISSLDRKGSEELFFSMIGKELVTLVTWDLDKYTFCVLSDMIAMKNFTAWWLRICFQRNSVCIICLKCTCLKN